MKIDNRFIEYRIEIYNPEKTYALNTLLMYEGQLAIIINGTPVPKPILKDVNLSITSINQEIAQISVDLNNLANNRDFEGTYWFGKTTELPPQNPTSFSQNYFDFTTNKAYNTLSIAANLSEAYALGSTVMSLQDVSNLMVGDVYQSDYRDLTIVSINTDANSVTFDQPAADGSQNTSGFEGKGITFKRLAWDSGTISTNLTAGKSMIYISDQFWDLEQDSGARGFAYLNADNSWGYAPDRYHLGDGVTIGFNEYQEYKVLDESISEQHLTPDLVEKIESGSGNVIKYRDGTDNVIDFNEDITLNTNIINYNGEGDIDVNLLSAKNGFSGKLDVGNNAMDLTLRTQERININYGFNADMFLPIWFAPIQNWVDGIEIKVDDTKYQDELMFLSVALRYAIFSFGNENEYVDNLHIFEEDWADNIEEETTGEPAPNAVVTNIRTITAPFRKCDISYEKGAVPKAENVFSNNFGKPVIQVVITNTQIYNEEGTEIINYSESFKVFFKFILGEGITPDMLSFINMSVKFPSELAIPYGINEDRFGFFQVADNSDIDKVNYFFNSYKDTIKQGTGFINRNQCRLIFEDNPAKLTIQAKDMEAGFEVSFHGKKHIKYEDSINIDWTGNRYIIYNDDGNDVIYDGEHGGTALVSVAQPDTLDHVIVAYVYYNPNSPEKYIIAADERHQASRNPDLHRLHHLEFGATYLSGGEIVHNAQGDDDANISLSNIFITDEGLDFHTIHSDNPYNSEVAEDILEQSLNPLKAPVLYLQATDLWACDTFNPDTPIKVSSNNIPTFNDRTNVEGGFQTELQDGQFVTYFIATTNSKYSPVKMIQGSIAHDSADDCFTDEFKALGLPMPEIVALWQIAYEYNSTYISEGNPYGIRIAQVRRPERHGGTQQSFGGQSSHALLSERNEPNQHQAGAIWVEEKSEALNVVLENLENDLDELETKESADINRVTLDGNELTKNGKSVEIPLASSTTHGAMPKESFQAIVSNTQRIQAIESGVIPIRISFTNVFSTANPTTTQITNYLNTLSPVPQTNLVRITDTDTRAVWVLNTNTNLFVDMGVDTITNFQEGVLGGIVGASDTDDGKVFAEPNGKGSIIGWNTVVRDDDIPTVKTETIGLIKPDDVDVAAFKGVVSKTTSYSSSLSATLDGITISITGGSSSSRGYLNYINNTSSWISVSQFNAWDESNESHHNYLIASGGTQQDSAQVGYTRGTLFRIKIATQNARIYECIVSAANGSTSTGITTAVIMLRRIV